MYVIFWATELSKVSLKVLNVAIGDQHGAFATGRHWTSRLSISNAACRLQPASYIQAACAVGFSVLEGTSLIDSWVGRGAIPRRNA